MNQEGKGGFSPNQNKVSLSISLNGFEFDYLSDEWMLNRNITVRMGFLKYFKQPLRDDIREALLYYAESYSAAHVRNITDNINLYHSLTKQPVFSVEGVTSLKNLLKKEEHYKLSVVRGFIRQMRYLELNENVNDDVYSLTDKWRLSGNNKGIPVLSLDPENGPFSDPEFEAIGFNSAHQFAEGKLNTESYCCLRLFKATGRRSIQLASIKCKDFYYSKKHTSTRSYVVDIPRAKIRKAKFRAVLKPYGLVNSVAQIVELHIKRQTDMVERALGRNLTSEEKGELPLFLDHNAISEMKEMRGDDLLMFMESELPHVKSFDLTRLLNSTVKSLGIISERTGRPLKSTGYRFRYTLGTRAAREGAGVLTIATLLDHSDTQNADVYIKNVPEHAVEISKIMNAPLARFASAFAGKIVKDEEEANAENAGATRIPCREKECDVGSCGTSSFCQDYAPIACYLCPKFRPWANAPHHLVLQWLMEERERLKADTNGDMEIVSINDRAILAVCQVINQCEIYNNG